MLPTHIAIDIGHARGTGAHSTATGAEEHASVAAFAPILAAQINAYRDLRAHTIDYPDYTNTADLNSTIAAINAADYALVISLHRDAYHHDDGTDDPDPHGAHACYTSTAGARLGRCIMAHLGSILPGRAEPIQHRPGLAILSQTRPVAVLLELGFITSPTDQAIFSTRQRDIAEAITRGIRDYILTSPPTTAQAPAT